MRRRGATIIALFSFIISLAFSSAVYVVLAIAALMLQAFSPPVAGYFAQGVRLSLYLAIFNLLPVPPLDGSKLLIAAKVPYVIYAELARFGFLLLLVALSATGLGIWMSQMSYEAAGRIFQALR